MRYRHSRGAILACRDKLRRVMEGHIRRGIPCADVSLDIEYYGQSIDSPLCAMEAAEVGGDGARTEGHGGETVVKLLIEAQEFGRTWKPLMIRRPRRKVRGAPHPPQRTGGQRQRHVCIGPCPGSHRRQTSAAPIPESFDTAK
jgi:hypothetical protein